MKVSENDRALTKRDLLKKLHKVEKALGTQAQRADEAERENGRLLAEIIRLRSHVGSGDLLPSAPYFTCRQSSQSPFLPADDSAAEHSRPQWIQQS